MNVILVMVQTADGRTTMWHEPKVHGWSSPEDLSHFTKLKTTYPILVMGKNTYVALKEHLVPNQSLRRIVMTSTPAEFANDHIEGQLEFTSESPTALVKRLEGEGHKDMLLVGGSMLNTAFLAKKLITECYLTIEPKFFGSGNNLFAPIDVDIRLQLINVIQLNKQGTLLTHYKVL